MHTRSIELPADDPESRAVFDCFTTPGVLDSLPDGAYVTDRNRRILYWSRGAERLTGWPAADVVGRTCYDNLLCHVDKDGHPLCGHEHCPLHRAITTGAPTGQPLLVFGMAGNGRRIPMEVSASPLRAADGTVVGGIEIFRDLTELMTELDQARRIQMHALSLPPRDDSRLWFDVRYTPQEHLGATSIMSSASTGIATWWFSRTSWDMEWRRPFTRCSCGCSSRTGGSRWPSPGVSCRS